MAIIHFDANPYVAEILTAATGSLVALTTARYTPSTSRPGLGANMAFITLEGGVCRFWMSGSSPSTNNGHIFTPGDILILDGYDQIAGFKFINEGATSTATMFITYFQGV